MKRTNVRKLLNYIRHVMSPLALPLLLKNEENKMNTDWKVKFSVQYIHSPMLYTTMYKEFKDELEYRQYVKDQESSPAWRLTVLSEEYTRSCSHNHGVGSHVTTLPEGKNL